jgi:serine kinase of HPr protein (carbohydrate metabolism regulator)
MTSPAPGVTVGGLLQARPETFGLDLEVLAGSAGLDRRITNPYVQKTGLALAGFHDYLRPIEARRCGKSARIRTCPAF